MDASGNLGDLNKTSSGAARGGAKVFDVRTAMALSRHSRFDRVAFCVAYAVIALLVLPWQASAAWVAVIVAWEWLLAPPMDPILLTLPEDQAAAAYAGLNLIGSVIYHAVPLLSLASGTPIGIGIGVTWITGSALNAFVYANASRALLLATLAPAGATALIGPWLAYGFSWAAATIPLVIGLSSFAARRLSLDHDALLAELTNRRFAFTDLERKLSIAVEASGDGMFEVDLPAGQLHVNANWVAMLGYEAGEIGPVLDWRDFLHPDDTVLVRRGYASHFQGVIPHTSAELRLRRKDGGYKWVLSRARLIERAPDGRPLRMVGTTIDISARKALELELEAARDAAEKANQAKNVFVANMSHEIRTPLNGVIGVAGALARTGMERTQREMVELIQSSGQMLDRMLSDILDQAKIEAGDFQLQIAPFDLRREIEAAAALMRARAEDNGLKFRVEYAPEADGWFAGDAVRLRQIISNLASNAVKFTQKGEVAVRVSASEAASGAPVSLRIEVADTGIGFDADAAERLFGRFVQADGSISRRFGGTGLGLAICKTLSELMGGEISARSRPEHGSTFTVILPLPRAEPPRTAARLDHEPAGQDGMAALSRARILLAEDHPTNQRVVQLILEPVGVRLMIVDDGLQAVEAFKPGLFDLILMDMQMPVMDGLAATRAIRELERASGVRPTPIVMFSANAMDEHLAMAAAAGADHHIAKPITPERLLAGVEAALAQSAGEDLDEAEDLSEAV
ncbi:MAG TPA: ATP-binding protein [Caulobacteraceae bacterium]|nr:ATP-binding protein [Caulobacteraceae bacterium]